MDSQEQRDRLEAVRPNSNDLAQQELRGASAALASDSALKHRFEKQLERDAQISQAMQNVPAPANLADRLLARLAAIPSATSDSVEEIAAPLALAGEFSEGETSAVRNGSAAVASPANMSSTLTAAPSAKLAKPTSPFSGSRRKLTSGLLALAASVVLMVLARGYFAGSELEVSIDQFQQQALAWKSEVRSNAWTTENAAAIVATYPIDRMLDSPQGYQLLHSNLADAQQLVVYNYSSRLQQAYLFVAQTELRTAGMNVQGIPPTESAPLSAGWRMAAWREGPLLYVLLHTGGPHELDRLVSTPGQIASTWTVDRELIAHAR